MQFEVQLPDHSSRSPKFPVFAYNDALIYTTRLGTALPNCGLIIGVQRFNVVYYNDLPEMKFVILNEDTHSTCISKTDIKN